ncbi:MAG: HD domain-containing protein [Butyrivibrio sp.]|nr:HD domain-containing protein [Butyrivibrio sp.]
MQRLALPFYLDTAGTIFATALGGAFPGLIVAVATNLIASFYNAYSLYFAPISVAIALTTAWFVRKQLFRRRILIPVYALLLALYGGGLGTLFQWALKEAPFAELDDAATLLAGSSEGLRYSLYFMLANFFLNLVDKSIAAGIGFLAVRLVPAGTKTLIHNGGWRQKPLTGREIREIRADSAKTRGWRLQTRMTIMLTFTVISITIIMGFISLNLYFDNLKKDHGQIAGHAAALAAATLDPDMLDAWLREGKTAPGYLEAEEALYRIRDSFEGVQYLYVIRIEQDGCRFIFDLVAEDGMAAYQPGDRIPFEEAFEPYLPALHAGEEIEPIESNDISGWVLTAYSPIRNARGTTVAYVGADISMNYLSDYVKAYILRVVLLFSGFFVLILGYGLWVSGVFLIYPTGSMAASVERFTSNNTDQKELEDNVRRLQSLDIHTGDEMEQLYTAICQMATDVSDQMRSLRHYAETTAQMQNGLIVTMADLVEHRDSDTGAHIQKTAAYVRIILQGLKRKGYYADKLTPKYMADVEMSAPLHDVGKISIPDAVLNKAGPLTDEEYEIMKSHTTAGKKIMEDAIDTVQGGSYLKEARNMAAYHHERWDGKGYPEGLAGEVIPLSARVMAVADVFDALTAPRVYKPSFPLDKVLAIITEGSGKQFDPKCVEVFLESMPEVKQVLRKYHYM